MESIISTERRCHVCGREKDLELHHIFFGVSNRPLSTKWGLTCYLCHECHQGRWGVHGYDGYELNTSLKKEAQKKWMEYFGKTKEDFISIFGKSYI